MKSIRCVQIVLFGLGLQCIVAQSPWVGTDERAEAFNPKIALKVYPFELSQVRLQEGPFKTAMETNRRYVESLNPDRLLKNFRVNARLPAPGEPLTGWEAPDCEIRGHFTGHYLSALAMLYAGTGEPALKQRGDYMVGELAQCQQALGGEYLAAFPEVHWDRWEAEQGGWAQHYTIHKIMAGLIDQYRFCANTQALAMAKGMAAYFKKRLDKYSDFDVDLMLGAGHWWRTGNETGGICDVLWSLYGLTGDTNSCFLAQRLEKRILLGQLALGHDCLSHKHGQTLLAELFGAARRYEQTGEPAYRTAVRYFWERVACTRSYATGGSTLREDWPEPNRLANTLGYRNQECCKTYSMLRLARHLIGWTADPHYADFYERALFNSILGTQEKEQGRLMYYVPLGTGFRKAVLSPTGHFYCCIGTGIESHAKFGDSIYFHDEKGIYVNLFIASVVDWKQQGIRLEQTTRFPDEEGTTLRVQAARPVSFALHLRVPYWATRGVTVKVNGQPQPASVPPGSYLSLTRLWTDGDRVEVSMPMSLHTQPMPDDPDLMAIMYGPLVLAGITAPDTTGQPFRVPPGQDFPDNQRQPHDDFFLADAAHLDGWIKPVPEKPLTFRTTGQAHDMTFIPFYRVTGERYGVYWIVTQSSSPRHQRLLAQAQLRHAQQTDPSAYAARRLARQVDGVIPGDEDSEKRHHFNGYRSAVTNPATEQPHGRRVMPGDTGWWTWDLKVLDAIPMTLLCTYWGSEADWIIEISVDSLPLAEQLIAADSPGVFFDVEYPLPLELTRGKEKVTVKFRTRHPHGNGTVFRCATLRAE